jgi:hypothetical protein
MQAKHAKDVLEFVRAHARSARQKLVNMILTDLAFSGFCDRVGGEFFLLGSRDTRLLNGIGQVLSVARGNW